MCGLAWRGLWAGVALFIYSEVSAWGFYGHGKINELAVYTLPKPLFRFYKRHVDYMIAHAADADRRRYSDTNEACRHFMDGDYYERSLPLDTVPFYFSKALETYGRDSVFHHGIVPWHVFQMFYRLTEAFKSKDSKAILRLSADLGHYVGDCHVPLHATSNYNGQKTGQKGIHALWESRLTEIFFDTYDLLNGQAEYLEHPLINVWQAYSGSFGLVDSVLRLERQLSARFDANDKYVWEQRGQLLVRTYSEKYCKAYHRLLGDMVEQRLQASVRLLGSLIYTAWVQAGQPILEDMPVEEAPVEPSKKGEMIGREEED